MKTQNLIAVICVIAAATLAFRQLDGWGWFLFVGFILVYGDLSLDVSEIFKNTQKKDSEYLDTKPPVWKEKTVTQEPKKNN